MNHTVLSFFISRRLLLSRRLLRGDYKRSVCSNGILPFIVLRCLNHVLETTKPAVFAKFQAKQKYGLPPDSFLLHIADRSFYNNSAWDMKKIMGAQNHIRKNLHSEGSSSHFL